MGSWCGGAAGGPLTFWRHSSEGHRGRVHFFEAPGILENEEMPTQGYKNNIHNLKCFLFDKGVHTRVLKYLTVDRRLLMKSLGPHSASPHLPSHSPEATALNSRIVFFNLHSYQQRTCTTTPWFISFTLTAFPSPCPSYIVTCVFVAHVFIKCQLCARRCLGTGHPALNRSERDTPFVGLQFRSGRP